MIILHVASFEFNPMHGVAVAVPQHVASQSKFASVALLNLTNSTVSNSSIIQYHLKGREMITDLPAPFDHPDIVVFHEVYRPEFIKFGTQLSAMGIPYIIMPHGSLTHGSQRVKPLKKALGNFVLFNKFINGALAIQFLSESELLNSRSYNAKGFVGPNGVTLPDTKKSSFRKNGVKLLYIGRMDVRLKGLDLMIESVARSRQAFERSNSILTLYGPDCAGGFGEVEKMIRRFYVGDLVKLNHEVLGSAKESILLDADVFIQTSRSEGMPMGVLEALSYGLPCLLTKGTALGEKAIEYDYGWAADCNVNSISEAIDSALCDVDAFRDKSKKAIAFIEGQMAWPEISRQTVSYYRKILADIS